MKTDGLRRRQPRARMSAGETERAAGPGLPAGHAHRVREAEAEAELAAVDHHPAGTLERLSSDHLEPVADRDVAPAQVAEHLRVGVGDPDEDRLLARL